MGQTKPLKIKAPSYLSHLAHLFSRTWKYSGRDFALGKSLAHARTREKGGRGGTGRTSPDKSMTYGVLPLAPVLPEVGRIARGGKRSADHAGPTNHTECILKARQVPEVGYGQDPSTRAASHCQKGGCASRRPPRFSLTPLHPSGQGRAWRAGGGTGRGAAPWPSTGSTKSGCTVISSDDGGNSDPELAGAV